MEYNGAEVDQMLNIPVKVHISMFKELMKVLERIIYLVPVIESARPGCMLGIQELCSLNNSIEKAKLLLQHCAESSKLYLVITAEASVSRCERIRNSIDHSLSHIHTMVPEPLANEIAEIIDSLRDAKFEIDFAEEDASKALLSLLRQTDATDDSEFKAFCIAASRLNLTSSKALLVERRCIQKNLDKLSSSDIKKERILIYLLDLVKRYGKRVQSEACEYKENVFAMSKDSFRETSSSRDASFCRKTSVLSQSGLQEENLENGAQTDLSSTDVTPEIFRCPISSRLMYDPVIIASGQTYERMFIEKWFRDGHDTCPKMQMKLSNLCMIPNASMRELISQWCQKHGISLQDPYLHPIPGTFRSWDTLNSSSISISSLNSISAVLLDGKNADYSFQNNHSSTSVVSSDSDCSRVISMENLTDDHAQIFTWSGDYQIYHSFANFTYEAYRRFLSELSELPLEFLNKEVEDMKTLLSKDDDTCSAMLSNGFLESLMRFLKEAYDSSNIIAQKTGVQILLAFLINVRAEIPSLSDDASDLLRSFLDSTLTLEALLVIQTLCSYPDCKSKIVASGVSHSIMKVLDSEDYELLEHAVEILFHLSSVREIGSQILSTRYMAKLVSLLKEKLAGGCLKILRNLCDMEESGPAIAESNSCIASVVELLDTGGQEEQADAVAILLTLCSRSSEYCDLVMKEGVIPPLVDISVNGNLQGRESSMKLLQLLRDLSRCKDCSENSVNGSGSCSPQPTSFCLIPPPADLSVNGNPQESEKVIRLLRDIRGNDCLESSLPSGGSISKSPPNPKNDSMKKKPTSKASGFFRSKMFFSKQKSMALF